MHWLTEAEDAIQNIKNLKLGFLVPSRNQAEVKIPKGDFFQLTDVLATKILHYDQRRFAGGNCASGALELKSGLGP